MEIEQCCPDMKIKKKNKEFFCVKCGQIDRYEPDTEFNNFHENMFKFTRKSVYYIIKVIFIVTKNCQLTTKNKQKVFERFELIGTISSEVINSTHNKIKYMSMPLTELSKRSSTNFFIDCFYQIVIVRNCLVDINNISFSLSIKYSYINMFMRGRKRPQL